MSHNKDVTKLDLALSPNIFHMLKALARQSGPGMAQEIHNGLALYGINNEPEQRAENADKSQELKGQKRAAEVINQLHNFPVYFCLFRRHFDPPFTPFQP